MSGFEKWLRLRTLSVHDLPECGGGCAVYAFRDCRDFKILKFGETDRLRRRIFGNFIGGVRGGRDQSTTQFIHRTLFVDGMVEHVELAWIETPDKATAKQMESQFRQAYKRDHGGRRPVWDRKD